MGPRDSFQLLQPLHLFEPIAQIDIAIRVGIDCGRRGHENSLQDQWRKLLAQLKRTRMKYLFHGDVATGYALVMAISKKFLQHMAIGFQAVRPWIGLENLLFVVEVMSGPSFDETRDRAAPALRPTFSVTVKTK